MSSEFRTSCFLSILICLSIVPVHAATSDRYGRNIDQLSQAIASYKELASQNEKYDVQFRRDPMRPLVDTQGNIVATSGLHEGLAVQGIIWSEERPLVVIEDELFAQGDVIDDYTIREIRHEGVVVEHAGTTEFVPIERSITR